MVREINMFGDDTDRSTRVLLFATFVNIGIACTLVAYLYDLILTLVLAAGLVVSAILIQEFMNPPRRELMPIALGSMAMTALVFTYRVVVRGDSVLFAASAPPSGGWFVAFIFFWLWGWSVLALAVTIIRKKGEEWSTHGVLVSLGLLGLVFLFAYMLIMFTSLIDVGDYGPVDRWEAVILVMRNYLIDKGSSITRRGTVYGSVSADAEIGVGFFFFLVGLPSVIGIALVSLFVVQSRVRISEWPEDTRALLFWLGALFLLSVLAILMSIGLTLTATIS